MGLDDRDVYSDDPYSSMSTVKLLHDFDKQLVKLHKIYLKKAYILKRKIEMSQK